MRATRYDLLHIQENVKLNIISLARQAQAPLSGIVKPRHPQRRFITFLVSRNLWTLGLHLLSVLRVFYFRQNWESYSHLRAVIAIALGCDYFFVFVRT